MHWERERIFHDGDVFFSNLCREMDGAIRSIDFETYIFDDDRFGARVVDWFERAAARGVRVRLMVDGFGAGEWAAAHAARVNAAGVEVRVFRPLPWFRLFGPVYRRPSVRAVLRSFSVMNRRNHRKVCVIDGTVAYLGGFNVSDRHLAEFVGDAAWRDSGARVEGPAVAELTAAFERAWSEGAGAGPRRGLRARLRAASARARTRWRSLLAPATATPPAPVPSGLVRINATRAQRAEFFHGLMARIQRATRRIWITNAYFIPRRAMLKELRRAVARGVDVRLLVPSQSDVFFYPWGSPRHFHSIRGLGIRVFQYLPSVLHAKTLLIDDWAVVGSSNLNHRSFLHDLEADAVLTSPEAKASLEGQFERDLSRSHELTARDWEERPLWRRILGTIMFRIIFSLRYWI